MAGLTVWPAMYWRPEFQERSLEAQHLILSMALVIADAENDVVGEGFFLKEWFAYIPKWKDKIAEPLEELEKAGLLVASDDPEGWLIPNWSKEVVVYRRGAEDSKDFNWGQTPLEKLIARREKDRLRKRKERGLEQPPTEVVKPTHYEIDPWDLDD